MNKFITKVAKLVLGLSLASGVGVAVGSKAVVKASAVESQAFSWSRSGTTDTVSSGYYLSATASGKSGYYQDASSGAGYIMVQKGTSGNLTNIWTSAPTSISFTAKVGGGSGNKSLSNKVYVCLVDTNGDAIANTEEEITDTITTAGGDTYNISFTTKPSSASGVKIYHEKETGYNVRYFSYSLSYEAASGTSYNITTTGVVNGTVSGATSIPQNGSVTLTLSPNNGFKLPVNSSSITVTNATVTSFDSSTGILVISNPTGAVSISVTMPAATQYSVSTSLTNLSATGDSTIYENGTATVTLTVLDSNTYALPTVLTSVTNAVDYSYNSSTGVVTISGASGNVVITASAIKKPSLEKEEFVFDDVSHWTATGSTNGGYTKTVDLITVAYNKTSANNNFYWNPARIYTNMKMDFSSVTGAGAVNTIKSVVFSLYNTASYYTALTGNVTSGVVGGGSIEKTSDTTAHTVTYTMSGTVTSFSLTPSAQTRIYSIEVNYEKDQSEVALNSISATCAGVLVSQQVTPVVTFNPTNATNKKLTFEITNGSQYANVDENTGLVTGLGAGTATIRITPDDTNASSITVDVVVTALPSIYGVTVGNRYAMVATLNSLSFELSGINEGSNYTYGGGAEYDTNPSNVLPVHVVNGLYAHTVALQVEIESATKYLSFDKTNSNNNLTVVSSIDRSSSWIFAEEDSSLVIRNVDVYARKLGATTSGNPAVGRFACYQNLSATVITPSFIEIAEVKTDAEYVQEFVDDYLHMDFTENLGYCKDALHGWYLVAKGGYNDLIYGVAARETLFASDATFAAAKARYEAWAVANNDAAPYDGNDTVVTKINANLAKTVLGFDGDTNNTIAIIVVISMVSVTAIGGYFFLKKRREQN